jgi:hypothetical protein
LGASLAEEPGQPVRKVWWELLRLGQALATLQAIKTREIYI